MTSYELATFSGTTSRGGVDKKDEEDILEGVLDRTLSYYSLPIPAPIKPKARTRSISNPSPFTSTPIPSSCKFHSTIVAKSSANPPTSLTVPNAPNPPPAIVATPRTQRSSYALTRLYPPHDAYVRVPHPTAPALVYHVRLDQPNNAPRYLYREYRRGSLGRWIDRNSCVVRGLSIALICCAMIGLLVLMLAQYGKLSGSFGKVTGEVGAGGGTPSPEGGD